MLFHSFLSFLLLSGASLAAPSAGCKEKATAKDVFLEPTADDNFKGRDLIVKFPPGYKVTKETPLILAYHDKDMSANEFSKLIDFEHAEFKNNAILVFLTTAKAWSPFKKSWMTDPESNFRPKEESFDSDDDDLENDLSYTRLLLNHLEHNHCIDTRRVYAVGLGTGAGVVHQLACHTHLSRRIAAYAPVNGAFYRPRGENDRMWGKCLIGRRPIPMLEIHGAENGEYHLLATMDKAKSLEIVSAEEWVGDWRALNNCGANMGSPVQSIASKAVWLTQLENGQLSESTTYGGLALRSAYRCGAYKKRNNADLSKEEKDLRRITLLHYAIKGFEHGWPRMKGPERTEVFFKEQWVKPLGFPNFDASAEVLNFFRTHKLPDPDTLHGQAKALLIERGAKVYDFEKEAETQRLRMKHDEL